MIALYQRTDGTFVRLAANTDSHGKWKLSSNKGPLDITDLPGLRFIRMVDEKEEEQFRRDLVPSDCLALVRSAPGVLNKLDVLIHKPTGNSYVQMDRHYLLAEQVPGFEKFELKVPPDKVDQVRPVEPERKARTRQEAYEFSLQDAQEAAKQRQARLRSQSLDATENPRVAALRTAIERANRSAALPGR